MTAPITLHDGPAVRMVDRLTWGDAAAFLGGPPRVYALCDDEGGMVLLRGDVPHGPVPLYRRELGACTVPVVVVPEDRLDGEGGQCLPDRYSEEPTIAARLEVAERDLRDATTLIAGLRRQLAASQRGRLVLAGQLAEFIELARTAHRYMPEITKMQAITRDALIEQAADAETALRAAQGAPEGDA